MRPRRVVWIAGLAVAGVVAFAILRIGPRNILGMVRYDERREGDLKVGEQAPDVELVALDGTSKVHLRDFVDSKPLILLFGSYT